MGKKFLFVLRIQIVQGLLSRVCGQSLLRIVRGFGNAIAAFWVATYTWTLGKSAYFYFGDLRGKSISTGGLLFPIKLLRARRKNRSRVDLFIQEKLLISFCYHF